MSSNFCHFDKNVELPDFTKATELHLNQPIQVPAHVPYAPYVPVQQPPVSQVKNEIILNKQQKSSNHDGSILQYHTDAMKEIKTMARKIQDQRNGFHDVMLAHKKMIRDNMMNIQPSTKFGTSANVMFANSGFTSANAAYSMGWKSPHHIFSN